MRIVIPTNSYKGLDDTAAEHFGRCNTFTVLDEEGNVLEIVENTGEHMGGTMKTPEIIKNLRGDVLLCKALGPRALDMFKELGIEVYVCNANTVKEMFELWKNKKIQGAGFSDVCEAHR